MSQRYLFLPLVLIVTNGCSGSGTADAAARPSPALELAQSAHANPTQAPPVDPTPNPASTAAAPTTPARIYYDLARHVAHAEVYEGDTLVMDYGVPGSAKYTLGGWLSGSGESRTVDDTSVTIIAGKTVKLTLPAERAEQRYLTLRLRSFKPGPLTVYVNGATLANVNLSGKESETIPVTVPEGLLKTGENTLQLRVSKTGSTSGVPNAGLAIDWIRLSTAALAEPSAPVAPAALASTTQLNLAQEMTLAYACPVPERAHLRARVQGDGSARVEVVAARDGEPPLPLGEVTATSAGAGLDVDLGRFAGQLVRLELRAKGGSVTLHEPQLVTLDAPPPSTATATVKNVIVLLIDTLRADKLKPYNSSTRVKTPGLDALVRAASVMTNARTQENWTKPSVATLLSSLLPWEHGATTDEAVVPNSVELMPEILRERGFYTGAFITNGYVSDKFGFKQGWHTYRNYIREGRPNRAQHVAADVLEWLDNRPQDQPFFLYVHTIDPHVPYKPPEHFLNMYDSAPYAGVVDFKRDGTLLENIKIGRTKLNARDKERLVALYDAEISYHDAHFAAMIEGLERRGLSDNTMIVITADHGEEFWDHGSVGHGHSVYDELLHVPLVVKVPGITQQTTSVTDAVGLVDVLPTVLEVLGQPVPDHLAGHSFLPQLLGHGSTAPRTAVSGFMSGWRTLAVGNYKLVQRTAAHTMLYDVGTDPGEQTNLADARPIALRYLRGQLGLVLDGQTTATTSTAVAAAPRPRPTHKAERTEIDSETEAQLRALGYVGTSAH